MFLKNESTRKAASAILLVLTLYLATIAIVRPFGEYPLNDDWSYAKTVKTYVETGKIQLTSWVRMTFLAQMYYGSLFVRAFGFSHLILRVSTMGLTVFTFVVFFLMLRTADISPRRAALGCICLLSNPFFLGNSFTFMSEIPYLFSVLVATLLYSRSCERDAPLWLALLAGMAAGAAMLVRQTAILLPLAAVVSAALSRQRRKTRVWANTLVFSLFPLASLFAFEIWLHLVHGPLPATWQTRHLASFPLVCKHLAEISAVSICYLGLLSAPVTLSFGLFQRDWWKNKRTATVGLVALAALSLYSVIRSAEWTGIPADWRKLSLFSAEWMPYLGNTWFDLKTFGQGPYILKDVIILHHLSAVACPDWIFVVATALSVVMGAAFATILWEGRSKIQRAPTIVRFSVTAALLHLGLLTLQDFYLDRNLLPVFPFALLVLLFVLREDRASRALAGVCACLLYVITVAGVFQYHRWNDARWQAIDYLKKEVGASPHQIDGGFEYNGWMFFDDYFGPPRGDNSWWWVYDDKYIIAFSEIDGCRILRRFPFRSAFPFVSHEILALERKS
ncbi:glycosyltransferase family 39 protein [Candidatus Poribacteria bacterium]|nr:glycosyltransferase family 39 protein [Candidatus Poribacteria bacterium]